MIKQIIIDSFDGGIEDDVRTASANGYACSSHFDVSQPHRLVPLKDMEAEADITGAAIHNYDITDFVYHKYSSGSNLFALGINYNTNTNPAIFEKSGDVITSAFTLSTNSAAATGTAVANSFFEYQQNLYFIRNSNVLVKYARASVTLTATAATFSSSGAPTGKPFHHKKSDIVYVPFSNILSQWNGTAVSDPLTLPTSESITALAEYGTYLAIATSPAGNATTSCKLYIYDMVSSDVTDVITIGEGVVRWMENINGTILIGVSNGDADAGSTFYGNTSRAGIKIYAYAGGQNVTTIKEFVTRNANAHTLTQFTSRKNDVFYFATEILQVNGSTRTQLWVLHKNRYGKWVVEGNALPKNDTVVSNLRGFSRIGDYLWISYDETNTHEVRRSNDATSFTASSLYESQIFTLGDSSTTKKLLGATVMTEPLPTAGQIILQYRKDEATSWTDIFTHTTDDSISHSAINHESTGATLPEFKEIQFRIKSTGGAVITGLKFKVEVLDKDIY